MSGVPRPHLFFAVSRLFFTLRRDWSYATFLCIRTALTIWYWGTAQLWCWVGGSLVKLFSRLSLSRFWMSICLSWHSNFCPAWPPMKIPFYFTTDVFEKMLMIFRKVYSLFMTVLPIAQIQQRISVYGDGDFGGKISRKWDCIIGGDMI